MKIRIYIFIPGLEDALAKLAKDKAAVASSLRRSAMHSSVRVPIRWDFASELAKVGAHLAAQARYRHLT